MHAASNPQLRTIRDVRMWYLVSSDFTTHPLGCTTLRLPGTAGRPCDGGVHLGSQKSGPTFPRVSDVTGPNSRRCGRKLPGRLQARDNRFHLTYSVTAGRFAG